MADLKAAAAESRRPSVTVTGVGQATVNHGVYALAAALAVNDTVALCKLPAGHVPVDFVLDTDELDTGADAIVLDIGIYEEDLTVVDIDALIAASTIGQAGGVARMAAVAGRRLAPSNADRLVVATVSTGPGTGAATGTIQGTLISRAANPDD